MESLQTPRSRVLTAALVLMAGLAISGCPKKNTGEAAPALPDQMEAISCRDLPEHSYNEVDIEAITGWARRALMAKICGNTRVSFSSESAMTTEAYQEDGQQCARASVDPREIDCDQ